MRTEKVDYTGVYIVKIDKLEKEIERLTENNLSMQGEMARTWKKAEEKDKEIKRLTAESTKWESKFYDEAKKVDKAIEYLTKCNNSDLKFTSRTYDILYNILRGDDIEKN